LIINWHPLGLFYKAFAGVMSWFGVDLPKSFTEFGANLIGGLVGGITAKFGAAKEAIVNFGGSIKDWFTDTLGIHSPSRVFLGFGDNIAQGAALGVTRSSPLAGKAVAGMALAAATAWGQPQLAAPMVDVANSLSQMRTAPRGPAAGTGMVIHFSPQITIQGDAPAAVRDEVNKALQLSYAEFERLMKRYEHEKRRVSYAIRGNLSAASQGNLTTQLTAAEGAASRASTSMQAATVPLARLAARAATRNV
jgi:hypothetical protein